MDNKSIIFIAFPFILVIILVIIAGYFPFDREWSPAENIVRNFSPANLAVRDRVVERVKQIIQGPFDFEYIRVQREEKTVGQEGEEKLPEYLLTLVVISGEEKRAVVNGSIVQEGDRITKGKIMKIEKDRVLLKDKTLHWIQMGKVQ